MESVHLILMGKGGVGKSLVSSFLTQYLKGQQKEVYCADTDPTNATFSAYKAFKADHIKILTESMGIDKSNFDMLIEKMIEHDGPCVVDNGASSFLPMMEYLSENQVMEYFQSIGRKVVIHAPLVGGQAMLETIRGLESILKFQVPNAVIWENEYYGPVRMGERGIRESEIYRAERERILGIVKIAERSADTFGRDMRQLTTGHLTFDEAKAMPEEFRTMQRQRLTVVQREINDQLDKIEF